MDILLNEFSSRKIFRYGLVLFTPTDAIEVITRCKEMGIKILGLEAFIITDNTTQPFSEHSIDYSFEHKQEEPIVSGNWDEAVSFLEKYIGSNFLFEIEY